MFHIGGNDVDRIVRHGMVRLGDALTVECHSHVMHLCRTVTGRRGLLRAPGLAGSPL